jgi:GntR family transcriptional regulator
MFRIMDDAHLVGRLAQRLRRAGVEPVSQLLVEELWLAVIDGSLEAGARLPTARQLAIALNVSPRSIERTYQELERRGVLATRQGAGTYISLSPPSSADHTRHRQFAQLCREVTERTAELGFSLDELLDALAEYRTADPSRITEQEP